MSEASNLKKRQLIFLCGFMGSGKSTIGPILANTLGYRFIDLDSYIEEQTSKKVTELFAEFGEPKFRSLETESLHSLAAASKMIIALGGGTLLSEVNRRFISENGILIYLQTDIEHIVKRLTNKKDRPLLFAENGSLLPEAELFKRIEKLLAVRQPYYTPADIIVSTSKKKIGVCVDEIVRKIHPFLAEPNAVKS